MTQFCKNSDADYQLLLALIYDHLLSLIFLFCNYPIYSVYFLYFSPYIIELLYLLFPLLTTTFIIFLLENEASTACSLDQLCSVVFVSFGNVFEWEFEAMSELYKNASLNVNEVEKDPSKIFAEKFVKSELLESLVASGERAIGQGSSFESQIHNKEIMSELYEVSCRKYDIGEDSTLSCDLKEENSVENSSLICFAREYQIEHSTQNTQNCGITEGTVDISSLECDAREELIEHSTRNCHISKDKIDAYSKKSNVSEILELNLEGYNFIPQTPDRNTEILVHSPSVRQKAQRSLDFSSKNALLRSQSEKGKMHQNLSNSPSMRKEKEWKRTLACKLYEERMTFKLCEEKILVEGAEEMDMLWEAYESDANKTNKLKNRKGNNAKKDMHIEEVKEDDDDDDIVGQLCCLQALKFSSGKRPNLSKIFKSIGLSRCGSSRSRKE